MASKNDPKERLNKPKTKPHMGLCGDVVTRVLSARVKGRRKLEWWCEKHGLSLL